jgi:hypothetical protein
VHCTAHATDLIALSHSRHQLAILLVPHPNNSTDAAIDAEAAKNPER